MWWLGWRYGALALPTGTFFLGVLRLGGIVLAPFGLPPCRLPAAEQAEAFGVLTVTLVPTLRLVHAFTAFAQADPRPRLSRTGIARAGWTIITVAHGSVFSQGTARGECANVLLGRL